MKYSLRVTEWDGSTKEVSEYYSDKYTTVEDMYHTTCETRRTACMLKGTHSRVEVLDRQGEVMFAREYLKA